MRSFVASADLPATSKLHAHKAPDDFLDCYCVDAQMSPRQAAQIITRFPRWVSGLLRIRGWLTAPFGLRNDGPPAQDKIGLFPVVSESDSELIAGFNDKHLDFRISVLSLQHRIYLATWVHTHNWGGRLYLGAIYPIHVMVVRNAMTRVARQRDVISVLSDSNQQD